MLVAAYAPVVAWLQADDTWLMPITVAGLIGYVLIVDDVVRHRAARSAQEASTADPVPREARNRDVMAQQAIAREAMTREAMTREAMTRGHRLRDDPESSPDASAGTGQRPDR